VGEEIKADKSSQDVIIGMEAGVETESVLVRVKEEGSKVLIYGRPLGKDKGEQGEHLTLTNNLNLSILKNDQNHLTQSLEEGNPLDLRDLAKKCPIKHLRQLLVRGLTSRSEKVNQQGNVAKWHRNQMQLWLLEEDSHAQDQEILDKVGERVKGALDYLANPLSLNQNKIVLRTYLSTLEELCLILEREYDKRPLHFLWDSQQSGRLFDPLSLNNLIRKALEGTVDGINEQNKAVRLLLLLVSDLSQVDVLPVEAVEKVIHSHGWGLKGRNQVSLTQSLRFIRLMDLIWWNRTLRMQVCRSLKQRVNSRQVFKVEKEKKIKLGKRSKMSGTNVQKDKVEMANEKKNQKKYKKMWKETEIKEDSEVFYKVIGFVFFNG
jgi:hypothetical protein